MGDAENTGAVTEVTVAPETPDYQGIKDGADNAAHAIKFFAEQLSELNKQIEAAPKGSKKYNELKRDAKTAERYLKDLFKVQSDGNQASKAVDKLAHDLSTLEGKAGKAAEGITKRFLKSSGGIADAIKDVIKPAGALFGQATMVKGLEMLDEKTGGIFTKMQKPLLDMEKRGMQMSLGLGRSFSGSVDHLNKFTESLTATALDTNVFQETVTEVTNAFGGAFDSKQATAHLGMLTKATDNVRGELNLTKTALLTGAATGMKHAEVAGIMSTAHLELGETVEGSAKILGNIALAADKSGLGFKQVSESVMKAAGSLKLWGGTVGAVTPVYNAFSRALGEGRKGLAPELFEQYISGLQGMQFEMKALVGMQGGGPGGPGAIGAGLEMEALMEDKTGEGMKEMSSRLIDTIKQFSGGEMITRDQAIADPTLERNFIIQRQLLKQMVGGSDASATKMMGILKDIDQHGMDAAGDAESRLGDMLGTGERVQDRTTDPLTRSRIKAEQLQINAGKRLASTITNVTKKFQEQIGVLRNFTTNLAKAGTFEEKDIQNLIKGLTGGKAETDVMKNIGVKGGQARQEVRAGTQTAQKEVMGVMAKLHESLSQKRKNILAGKTQGAEDLNKRQRNRLANKGISSVQNFMPELTAAFDQLGSKIGDLESKDRWSGGLGTEQKAQLEIFKQAASTLESAMQSKRIRVSTSPVKTRETKPGVVRPITPVPEPVRPIGYDKPEFGPEAVRPTDPRRPEPVKPVAEKPDPYGLGREMGKMQSVLREVDNVRNLRVPDHPVAPQPERAKPVEPQELPSRREQTGKPPKEDVSSKLIRLIDAMKRLSGGQIATREDAEENPELKRNSNAQINLIRRLTKVDADNANKMIGILKNLDKNTIDKETAKENLDDILIDKTTDKPQIETRRPPEEPRQRAKPRGPRPPEEPRQRAKPREPRPPEEPRQRAKPREPRPPEEPRQRVKPRGLPRERDLEPPKALMRSTDRAEERVQRAASSEYLPTAPTKDAIEATQQVRREKVELDVSVDPKAVEQDVKLNIKADKNIITIEIDDHHIERVVTRVVDKNR